MVLAAWLGGVPARVFAKIWLHFADARRRDVLHGFVELNGERVGLRILLLKLGILQFHHEVPLPRYRHVATN